MKSRGQRALGWAGQSLNDELGGLTLSPDEKPGETGAWLGALERVEFSKNSQIRFKIEKLDSANH